MTDNSARYFESIPTAAPDPILGTIEAFRRDDSPKKVNLGIGVYQDENGKTPILECIKKAAALWAQQEDTKAYLPIEGAALYNSEIQKLLFGSDSPLLAEKRVATVQTVGGSGALRVGADLLKAFFKGSSLFVSNPTWDNHQLLFTAAGHQVQQYPYYDASTRGLAREAMFAALEKLEKRSIVLVHACCHNPTGVDLAHQDWTRFAALCRERELIPFVDFAYQGFGDGLEEDAFGVRALVKEGLNFLVSTSFSKSFSMYRERVGALSVVCSSSDEATRVLGQLKRIIRTIYSNPNSYGAQLVGLCLSKPDLRKEWEHELGEARSRTQGMRAAFTQGLSQRLPDQDFSYILSQKGMFSYFGLTTENVRQLREKHHVYAIESGRVCVAAMTPSNLEYVCAAIADVWG